MTKAFPNLARTFLSLWSCCSLPVQWVRGDQVTRVEMLGHGWKGLVLKELWIPRLKPSEKHQQYNFEAEMVLFSCTSSLQCSLAALWLNPPPVILWVPVT